MSEVGTVDRLHLGVCIPECVYHTVDSTTVRIGLQVLNMSHLTSRKVMTDHAKCNISTSTRFMQLTRKDVH